MQPKREREKEFNVTIWQVSADEIPLSSDPYPHSSIPFYIYNILVVVVVCFIILLSVPWRCLVTIPPLAEQDKYTTVTKHLLG